MLIDEADVIFKAGKGGPGKVSFRPAKKGGPDGGNGGRGGDLYIEATSDLSALRQFTHKKLIEAENGEPGGSNKKSGLDGEDKTILIPVGSLITSIDGKKSIELTEAGQKNLIAKGGLGGRGNFELKSSTRTTPMFAQPGLPGESFQAHISLRYIADFGLIGLPNTGKSSLLNELTRANAKVANYPFTTLEPNLGMLQDKIIADIPGLIEGASEGKGLGVKFLKHIVKVRLLIHCIAADSNNPKKDYQVIKDEMGNFDKTLLEKPELIIITKSDLMSEKELSGFKKLFKGKALLKVSIYDYEALEEFKKKVLSY